MIKEESLSQYSTLAETSSKLCRRAEGKTSVSHWGWLVCLAGETMEGSKRCFRSTPLLGCRIPDFFRQRQQPHADSKCQSSVRFSQRRTSQRCPLSRKSITCLGLEARLPQAPRGVLHCKFGASGLGVNYPPAALSSSPSGYHWIAVHVLTFATCIGSAYTTETNTGNTLSFLAAELVFWVFDLSPDF
jgi:hypothetical protein